MTVYVGPSSYPYGRMIMCHMVADSVDELHEMAVGLGLRRWFQDGIRPHYDICKSKRMTAIRLGAIEADEFTIVKVAKACKRGCSDEERILSKQ